MFPTVVLVEAEINLHERTPLGSLRFLHQMQASLLRSAVRFARITRDAGADNVFPRRRTAAITGNDVIQVQVFAIKQMAAVLAGVAVAVEDVVARELHLLFWHVVIREQQDDAREADAKRDRVDGFWMRRLLGEVVPRGKVVGLKRTVCVIENDLRLALKEQRESAPRCADIYRLP